MSNIFFNHQNPKSPEITDQNPQCGQNVENSSKKFLQKFQKIAHNRLELCCCCIMAIEKKTQKNVENLWTTRFQKKEKKI